jgi:hypothetical protein
MAGQVKGVHPAPLGQLVGVEQPVVQVAAEAVQQHHRVAGGLIRATLQVAQPASADLDRPGRRLGRPLGLLGDEAGLERGREGVDLGVGDRRVGQHPDKAPDRDDGPDLGHPAAQDPGRRRLDRPVDLLGARHVQVLQRAGERRRGVGGGHHLHRCLEVVEAVLGDQRGDVGGHAAARVVLVDHHQPARLLHRLEDGVGVQGAGGAHVDDLAVDAVVALADQVGLPEGDRVALLRDLALCGVEHLVLEEDHRVVVADGADQQALGVIGVEGTATLSPGTWVKIEYRLRECWLAARMPAPHMVRITIGTRALPPNM